MATGVAHSFHQLHHGSKRKSSAAGLPGNGRPVKRRASKACHCCRSRKVRCDVVESGIPCTNCRLDEVECVVTEGKRRKKTYAEGECLHHSPIESIEEKEDVPQFPIFDDIDGLHDIPVPVKPLVKEASSTASFEHELNHHRPHMIYQTQGHRLTPEERTRRLSTIGQLPKLSTASSMRLGYQMSPYTPVSGRFDINLPHYIAAVPKQVPQEDLEYLQCKGAFYIPEAGIRNELLRSYVQYVHPYLPLLELQDFLSAVESNGSQSKVSLLLFQSVMFAATAYIDMRYITAMGYVSRKSARKAFFQRVKLLYDFDWETDRVTVVQSVLLMTYWYESPNDPKDVWHWLGVAISIARTIGLNCDTDDSLLNTQKRRLWKRVWWCCYMRDRLVAIGMRRPIRIREEDYDLPMLTVDDFETNALPPELCRMLGGCSAVRDGSKRTTLAKMCIAVVEMCKLITDVLSAQYSVLGHKIGITSETTVRLVPRKSGIDSSKVVKCDRNLERWYSDLPLELRFFVPGSRERTSNHDGEVISVHRALLTGIYLTATSALHRPQMMPVMPGLAIDSELTELSKRRVREAAVDITEIFCDLYAHDLIRYLPNTGVTIILPAIIIHLLDIKSVETVDRQTSLRHFQFCMQALQKLREVYSSADFAFSFLDAATRKSAVAGSEAAFGGSKAIPAFQNQSSKKQVTLTPPPDTPGKNSIVRRSSGSSNSSSSSSTQGQIQSSQYNALTPPSSEQSLSSAITGGAAISLDDLEHLIDIDGMSADSNMAPFEPFSLDTANTMMQSLSVQQTPTLLPSYNSHDGSKVSNANNNSNGNRKVTNNGTGLGHRFSFPGQTRPSSTLMNDFDKLVHLEGGPDLFAPTKVNIDDNLFKDIDMEWLAEPDQYDEDDNYCSQYTQPISHTPGTKQSGTPESDRARSASSRRNQTPIKPEHHYKFHGRKESQAEEDQAQAKKMAELEADQTFERFPISDDLDLDLSIATE